MQVVGRKIVSPAGRVAIALSFLLVWQISCAIPGFGPPPISAEERAAYGAAMANLPASPTKASAALLAYIETYPKSQLSDDALEQLALLAFASNRRDDGMAYLARILREYPNGDRAAPARLRLAQQEYASDRRDAARTLLARLKLDDLESSERRAALRLLVALSRTPVERMGHLAELRETLVAELDARGDDRAATLRLRERLAALDADLDKLVAGAAQAELLDMQKALRGQPPAGRVALELARRAIDANQFDVAARRLSIAQSLVRGDLEQGELRLLTERLEMLELGIGVDAELPRLRDLVDRPVPTTEGAQGSIGVVLPLSGDFADFGEQALRGMLLATELFEAVGADSAGPDAPEGPGQASADGRASDPAATGARAADPGRRKPRIRLVVRDTGGDPQRAEDAVRELAADPGIVGIVGPIFSAESFSAADTAQFERIPLVTLSHREDVPEGRSQVFRTRTTPADEVGVLVEHAFSQMGAERFAVLYPRNRYGRGMRKLYWEAVRAHGGKMVATGNYDPDAVDFSGAIRDMIGYRFLTDWERKALDERVQILRAARVLEPEQAALVREAAYTVLGPEAVPLPPIVDFDVLFIPDEHDKIELIAPALAFNEVRDVKLLGSSDWLDDELLRVARQHVSGSVISTSFDPRSEVPFVAQFVEGFEETFGEEPDAYSAQAFDAMNLVLVQLAAGRTDRTALREGLLAVRAYPGATGVLTMRPDGNARRRPFLIGVRGRRFLPLD